MEGNTPEAGAADAALKAPSIADELIAVHEGLTAEREPEVFLLPGWGKKLQVEYRVLRPEETDEIGDRIADQIRAKEIDNPAFMVLIDGLIAACVQFITQVDGEDVPLHVALEGDGAKPIRWGDPRLREMLRIDEEEAPRVRHVVRAVLGDDRLAQRHAAEVNRWSERELEKVHADFTKASPATSE
jgi:hypothetical protein